LTLSNSTVSGNVSVGNISGVGGAGGPAGAGVLLTNGKPSHAFPGFHGFHPGRSNGYGGGIHSANSTIDLSQDTVFGNAADQGGGVFINSDTSSQLDNCTIAFNRVWQAGEGGGLWVYLDSNNDPVVVISTVLAENTTLHHGVAQDLFVGNSYSITADYSLIQSFTAGAVTGTNDIEDISPLLSLLGKNGGSTLTCMPSLVSPVLGAGSNPNKLTSDQRGHAREAGGTTDIGAVEEA
jgi:hypothetical protein